MAGLGGKDFQNAKEQWNRFNAQSRIDFLASRNIPLVGFIGSGFKDDPRMTAITPAIKGWIQLTNPQKRLIIDGMLELGLIWKYAVIVIENYMMMNHHVSFVNGRLN